MRVDGWILAGRLDGRAARPAPAADVCGMPHLLRLACGLAAAGVDRITVVWPSGAEPPPDLAALLADPRLGGRPVAVVDAPPAGGAGDRILLVRADRVFHRDLPRTLARAGAAAPAVVAGAHAELDAVVLAGRDLAEALARAALEPDGWRAVLAELAGRGELAAVAPPWRAFSVAAPDARALAAAERRLLGSLRKPIDGLAARFVNRHVSLAVTRRVMRTGLRPNHVTAFTLACGVAAGVLCALGGYAAAVAAVVLLELGSVLDGVDGELARLKYLQSRLGEWLDTLSDDLANLSFLVGATIHLAAAGRSWAFPTGAAAVAAFCAAQALQYRWLARAGTGDLLAFQWNFVGSRSWSSRLLAAVAPLVKRDFFVTAFVVLVAAGRLDVVLILSSLGAWGVLLAVAVQLFGAPSRAARRGLPRPSDLASAPGHRSPT